MPLKTPILYSNLACDFISLLHLAMGGRVADRLPCSVLGCMLFFSSFSFLISFPSHFWWTGNTEEAKSLIPRTGILHTPSRFDGEGGEKETENNRHVNPPSVLGYIYIYTRVCVCVCVRLVSSAAPGGKLDCARDSQHDAA